MSKEQDKGPESAPERPERGLQIVSGPVQIVELPGGLIFISGLTKDQLERYLATGSIYEQKESTGLYIEPINLIGNFHGLKEAGLTDYQKFLQQQLNDYMLSDPEEGEDYPGSYIEVTRE